MKICVFGSAKDNIDQEYITAGEKLGKVIARQGHTLIFGGGAGGLMGAAARGVSAEGGKCIGILPEMFKGDGIRFQACTEVIYTKTMGERKQIMEDRSDAFVITPGGLGTFDELFEVLTLRHLGLNRKPIVFLNTKNYFAELETVLKNIRDNGFMPDEDLGLYSYFDDPASLVAALEDAVSDRRD